MTFAVYSVCIPPFPERNICRYFCKIEFWFILRGNFSLLKVFRSHLAQRQLVYPGILGLTHDKSLSIHVNYLTFCHVKFFEFFDVISDPFDGATIGRVEGVVERYIARARGVP